MRSAIVEWPYYHYVTIWLEDAQDTRALTDMLWKSYKQQINLKTTMMYEFKSNIRWKVVIGKHDKDSI